MLAFHFRTTIRSIGKNPMVLIVSLSSATSNIEVFILSKVAVGLSLRRNGPLGPGSVPPRAPKNEDYGIEEQVIELQIDGR